MENKELIECIEAQTKELREGIEHAIILIGNKIAETLNVNLMDIAEQLEHISEDLSNLKRDQ